MAETCAHGFPDAGWDCCRDENIVVRLHRSSAYGWPHKQLQLDAKDEIVALRLIVARVHQHLGHEMQYVPLHPPLDEVYDRAVRSLPWIDDLADTEEAPNE